MLNEQQKHEVEIFERDSKNHKPSQFIEHTTEIFNFFIVLPLIRLFSMITE